MTSVQRITPCLWFDSQAEEAARYYVSVFNDSAIATISHYGREGFEVHGRPAGTVMSAAFRLAGQDFLGLNGGPLFKFSEAISFIVSWETQAAIDRYWDMLSAGGDEKAQACGWLKDKFGVSWQIVPAALPSMMRDADASKSGRLMDAMMAMKKLDIAALQRAYDGR